MRRYFSSAQETGVPQMERLPVGDVDDRPGGEAVIPQKIDRASGCYDRISSICSINLRQQVRRRTRLSARRLKAGSGL